MIKIESRILGFPGSRMIDRTQEEIKNEPMLFNCDFSHAMNLGGPITKEFLKGLPVEYQLVPLVIDTRVHMLMPGWYPCIPGWHHDDVPRTLPDGQPNYGEGQDRARHIIALVNGDICPTEIAHGFAHFSEVPRGQVCYSRWHDEVEYLIREGMLHTIKVPTNYRVEFDDRTWHRGTAAVANGWRWFGRASRYYDEQGKIIARRNERTNEVRKQVQVYLEKINGGW